MKKIIILLLILSIAPNLYAARRRGRKNLYKLVEKGTIRVCLGEFTSVTSQIKPKEYKKVLAEYMLARWTEDFEIVKKEEEADIVVSCDILSYKYLADDPVDHIAGGATGLIVDAFVDQNYVQIKTKFSVYRATDNKKLWQKQFPISVTESDMPEPESIPKILKESSKRFVFLCFGKPKRL